MLTTQAKSAGQSPNETAVTRTPTRKTSATLRTSRTWRSPMPTAGGCADDHGGQAIGLRLERAELRPQQRSALAPLRRERRRGAC